MEAKIKVTAETEGFDKTIENVEALKDTIGSLPPQVTIQKCSNCTINVYASQTVFGETLDGEEDE